MTYRTSASLDTSFCLLCASEGPAASQCEVCFIARPTLEAEPTMNRARRSHSLPA